MKNRRLVVMVSATALAAACVVFEQRAAAQSGTRYVRPTHYDALWSWLRQSSYTNWKGADGAAPEFEKGTSPHGAFIKTYVSEKASGDLKNLASGSVIVKENYNADKQLMAVTVMQRAKGYDPDHGDWYYAKYLPSGRIARTPPDMNNKPIAGKFKSCIDCHSGAEGDDFVFLND